MASSVDVKVVIQNIVDGTLAKKLCLICLMPLDELSEHILTRICKEDKEYCIADVLEELCHIKFTDIDQDKICSACFITASAAYKFYLQAKRSQEIINFYVQELEDNVNSIDKEIQETEDSVCISLPIFLPKTESYDYDLEGLALQDCHKLADEASDDDSDDISKPMPIYKKKNAVIQKLQPQPEAESDIVVVMDEDGQPSFYRHENGNLSMVQREEEDKLRISFGFPRKFAESEGKVKQRRRRGPMSYLFCTRCPIKYRFVAKLKEHMKSSHDIDLFVCQVCKAMMEDEQEFNNHLKTHTNTHICAICHMVFKKRETIISHLKKHNDEQRKVSKGSHICELCGQVLADEEHLREHYDKKHDKKYTCYYCGKMYKGELSFESHIRKHEIHMKDTTASLGQRSKLIEAQKPDKKRDRKYHCEICDGKFMDERALMWHTRLHTNERPYICDVCGRGFVSVNRRNQHAMCAHTAPSRRCPLCPALFHLRSMVNTHVKKVHLKAHKRRNRTSKYQEVYWRTEPVPIQELSVSIQNEILELKASQETASTNVKNEYILSDFIG